MDAHIQHMFRVPYVYKQGNCLLVTKYAYKSAAVSGMYIALYMAGGVDGILLFGGTVCTFYSLYKQK